MKPSRLVFVTGGTGYMGRRVIPALLARGHRVRALVREGWAKGIPRELVDRSIENSLCFGLYDADSLVGFARVISDNATFAYLSDVFVLESHRGLGLATWFMEAVMAHPDLQGIRRWMLATADAHGLYRKVGFTPLSRPERIMEELLTDAYGAGR